MKNIIYIIVIILWSYNNILAQCDPNEIRQKISISDEVIIDNPAIPPAIINNTPPPTQTSGIHDRYVFWLHGFGGNANAWNKPAEASQGLGANFEDALPDFPARRLLSRILDYNSGNKNESLVQAATYLKDEIEEGNIASSVLHEIDVTKNFMIAHSEGGIVSRMYEKLFQNEDNISKFGGLVTFGSTHGGAEILNNKEKIFDLAGDACNNLAPALIDAGITTGIEGTHPAVEFIINQFRPLIVDPVLNFSSDEINNLLCENVVPFVLDVAFAGQLKPIGNDYKVGATPITELSTFSTDIPKISIYGTEDNNHLWRAMHSIIISPAADEPLFDAQDEGTVNHVNDLLVMMQGELDRRNIELNNQNFILDYLIFLKNLFPVPYGGINLSIVNTLTKIKNSKKAIEKQETGINFLGSMNEKWLNIIGAHSFDQVGEITEEICYCTDPYLGNEYVFTMPPTEGEYQCDYGSQLDCTYYSATIPILIYKYEPNDAVALNESSLQLPGMNRSVRMEESNHMQMRNDANLKNVLNSLYFGDIMPYFLTLPRN